MQSSQRTMHIHDLAWKYVFPKLVLQNILEKQKRGDNKKIQKEEQL